MFFSHTLTQILCVMHKGPGLTTFTGFSPANFKRPIVILGPLNDIAMEKLAREMPDDYEVAGWFVLGSFDTPFLFLSIISLLFHLFSSSSIYIKYFGGVIFLQRWFLAVEVQMAAPQLLNWTL